jgi:histidinol-phosphate aminotransferase
MIILDANESPFDLSENLKQEVLKELSLVQWNRYPDIYCDKLRIALGEYVQKDYEMIAVGNGSDEIISLALKALVRFGDSIMTVEPTFSMYSFYAKLNGIEVLNFNYEDNFELDIAKLKRALEIEKPKMLILCNPNNPTGSCIELEDIKEIISDYDGYLLLDEAYYEFNGVSGIGLLEKYKNVIILRTLSKAFGLAGLRVGYAVASKKIIESIFAVKSPYNVNSLTQTAALKVLENIKEVKERVEIIKSERERMYNQLNMVNDLMVYPSKANFLLMKSLDSDHISEKLKKKDIKIRYFENSSLKNFIRVTIGSREENDKFLEVLGGI